jgi:hypothetical protein
VTDSVTESVTDKSLSQCYCPALHCPVAYNESEYSNENLFVSRVLQCVPLFGTINFIWWNK